MDHADTTHGGMKFQDQTVPSAVSGTLLDLHFDALGAR